MKWLWVAAFWMQKCAFSGISSVDPLCEITIHSVIYSVHTRFWPTLYINTIYDCIFGEFPAKIAYIHRTYIWFWPTLLTHTHTHKCTRRLTSPSVRLRELPTALHDCPLAAWVHAPPLCFLVLPALDYPRTSCTRCVVWTLSVLFKPMRLLCLVVWTYARERLVWRPASERHTLTVQGGWSTQSRIHTAAQITHKMTSTQHGSMRGRRSAYAHTHTQAHTHTLTHIHTHTHMHTHTHTLTHTHIHHFWIKN